MREMTFPTDDTMPPVTSDAASLPPPLHHWQAPVAVGPLSDVVFPPDMIVASSTGSQAAILAATSVAEATSLPLNVTVFPNGSLHLPAGLSTRDLVGDYHCLAINPVVRLIATSRLVTEPRDSVARTNAGDEAEVAWLGRFAVKPTAYAVWLAWSGRRNADTPPAGQEGQATVKWGPGDDGGGENEIEAGRRNAPNVTMRSADNVAASGSVACFSTIYYRLPRVSMAWLSCRPKYKKRFFVYK
ncbi:unnamed protein product [Protopolystoma xenopodis]|uniref:Uncharacterized protein n=1 Tax=Protopolystoma xenopodis TaxID=117903 RepID=A0A3S5BFI8_9PLAT|nr:unnamed protein product [Protopolystoma xenopodis]